MMNEQRYRQARYIYKVARNHGLVRNRRLTINAIGRVIETLSKQPPGLAVPRHKYNWLAGALVKATELDIFTQDDLVIIDDLIAYLVGEVG